MVSPPRSFLLVLPLRFLIRDGALDESAFYSVDCLFRNLVRGAAAAPAERIVSSFMMMMMYKQLRSFLCVLFVLPFFSAKKRKANHSHPHTVNTVGIYSSTLQIEGEKQFSGRKLGDYEKGAVDHWPALFSHPLSFFSLLSCSLRCHRIISVSASSFCAPLCSLTVNRSNCTPGRSRAAGLTSLLSISPLIISICV